MSPEFFAAYRVGFQAVREVVFLYFHHVGLR